MKLMSVRSRAMSEAMDWRLGVMLVLSEGVRGCGRGGELSMRSLRSLSVEALWVVFGCLVF